MLGIRAICAAGIISVLVSGASVAGDVEIVDAKAKEGAGGWTFSVTLKHGDTGWDHYADLWEVYTPDGDLLGRRVLAHPHVNEQPFTRSLSGVQIPDGVTTVIIRGRDSVHGVSPQEFEIDLNR
ncbi:hypothetical protein [Roseibium alexandrii]|uniref:Uncharacterized protein n=1 Tax=Roseibium alexandrii (strain DSM 17067 / NCIMB 14079 / DFL-11) TaxID=244592 RepID=A0A5E8GX50_ROSAD|nr:hypothetical protein [Roseibium alexandrii]EEE44609.1 hypothetical protein SADFL11_1897 [Roseibium alexandrii DFL-11]